MSSSGENHLKTGGESLQFQNKLEVTNKISDNCYDTFQAMKLRRKHRYIIYKIGDDEIDVESVGARTSVRIMHAILRVDINKLYFFYRYRHTKI